MVLFTGLIIALVRGPVYRGFIGVTKKEEGDSLAGT
jgi:hypothetical protein